LYFSLFVYVVSVCGVTINKHFCGGELETVSILEPESCCDGETADVPDDCCSNESVYISNKTETINNASKVSIDNKLKFLQAIITTYLFAVNLNDLNLSFFLEIPDKPPFLEKEIVSNTMVLRI